MKESSFQVITTNKINLLLQQFNTINNTVNQAVDTALSGYFNLISDPTGFPNRVDSTLEEIDNTNRIFTISPTNTSFDFYYKGSKFTKNTSESITFANTEGMHHIYYDENGQLQELLAFDTLLIKEYCYIANFYWSVTLQKALLSHPNDERHSIFMDNNTHYYLHNVNGAKYKSGFSLTNFNIDGDGSLNSHSQFNVTSGEFFDEDIMFSHTSTNTFSIFYRENTVWKVKDADNYPLIYDGINPIKYNKLVSNNWTLQSAQENNYVLMHIFAVNESNTKVIGVVGINEYSDLTTARQSATSEISIIDGLPFNEFVALGTVIFQTSSLYTNATKAKTVTVDEVGNLYIDFRFVNSFNASGTIGLVGSHSLLSDLEADDHKQYLNSTRGDIRYYTKAEINTLVTDFITNTELTTTLSDYVTNTSLSTQLSNYYTKTEVDTLLNGYTSNSELTTALINYQEKTILTTQGDIYLRGASNVERLPIGLEKQVLMVENGSLIYNNSSNAVNPSNYCTFFDDFLSNATTGGLIWTTTSSGGTSTIGFTSGITRIAKNAGGITLASGANNNQFISYTLALTNTSSAITLLGNFIFETYINIPVLSTAVDPSYYVIGLHDSILTGQANGTVDGVFFYYDARTSANWQCEARSNSASTQIVTSSLVTANTWTKLKIKYNFATTTATYYINNVLVATINTNIPPATLGREVFVGYKLNKVISNGNNRYLGIDYVYFNMDYAEANKR